MPTATKMEPDKFRDNPAAIAAYLTEAFEKNDLGAALKAIRSMMRAQNVTELSQITGLRRESLYRSFRGNVDPPFSRILTLFAGLDVRIMVQPLPPGERPPRPTLGRPSSREKVANKTQRQAGRESARKASTRAAK